MANNLQKMFVIVPDGKETAFLAAHTGASYSASDAYADKIAFLEATGEIVTHGKVYALNANLLNADKDTEGSIKYQIAEAVAGILGGTPAAAFDTLKEISDWIDSHHGVDGSASGYLVEDVKTLIDTVGKEGAAGTPAVAGAIWTEGSMYKKVGEEYVEITDASTLVAGETYYTSNEDDTNPIYTPIPASRIAPANANIIGNGEDADTGDWYDYRLPVAGTATEATGLFKYVDDAVEAANSSADDAIKALDAEVTSTDGTNIQVKVTQVDGKITAVNIASEQYGTVTRTPAENIGQDGATAAAISFGDDASKAKLAKVSDLGKVAGYADDRIAEMKASLDADIKSGDNADYAAGKGNSVNVEVIETDGKITGVKVVENFATVTRTESAAAVLYTDEAEATAAGKNVGDVKTAAVAADLVVADADADKALKASAVADIKAYVDNVVADANQSKDDAIAALDSEKTGKNTVNSVDYTTVTVKEVDGLLDSVSVANVIGSVEESGDAMTVTAHGLIDAETLASVLNAIDPWFTYPE